MPRRDESGPPQAQGSENSSKYQQLEATPTPTPQTGEQDGPARHNEESTKSFEELLAEVQAAARAGLYDKAMQLCNQAFVTRPEETRAVMMCAIAACNVGDTPWAKHYYAMASAGQKHTIYNICSAKGIQVRQAEPSASKPDGAPASKTDEPPGQRSNEPLAPEIPAAAQRSQTGMPPGAAVLRNPSTEPPATEQTEPMAPSRPEANRTPNIRPGMLEPPRVVLAPSAPVAEQEPRRRWPVWMPWTIVGTGAVVTGLGGLLYTTASSEYHDFDHNFDNICPDGCTDEQVPSLTDRLGRARTLETTSRISLVAGGATIATGAVLLLMNRNIEHEGERFVATPGALSLQQETDGAAGHRWPIWMPWSVVGAGALVTGMGGILYRAASREYDSFDEQFDQICFYGCTDSEVSFLADRLERAQRLETASRISLVVGGATIATGAVLVFLNDLGVPTDEHAAVHTFVVPAFGPGEAGIAAGFSF